MFNDLPALSAEITLEEWLKYWYDTFVMHILKQSTAVSYRGYINNHIVPQIGGVKLSELNVMLLQTFFNDRYAKGKTGGGKLSPKTLRNIKVMLHSSLQKAADLELIQRNYTESVQLPIAVKPDMRVLSRREQERLIAELDKSEDILSFGVCMSLATGMRLGEILSLRWSDVDMKNSKIRIRRTVNRLQTLEGEIKTEIVVGTPKSSKSIRTVPFDGHIRDKLVEYRRRMSEILGTEPRSDDYVFSVNSGRPTEPKTMQKLLKKLINAAEIVPTPFHSLRHTFATRAIENNVDIKTLSELLGHTDVGTTVITPYGHTHPKQLYSINNLTICKEHDYALYRAL